MTLPLEVVEQRWLFEHGGKSWSLPRVSQDTKLAYSLHLMKLRRDGIRALYDFGTPDYKLNMKLLQDDMSSGRLGWRTQAFIDSIFDEDGVVRHEDNLITLILLWFQQADKSTTRTQIEAAWKDKPLEMVEMLGEMVNEKNPSTPSSSKEGKSPTTPKSAESSNENPSTKPASTSEASTTGTSPTS